ncbi:MFS transporter [Brevibacterium oceani]|uniref:MFS transporter n=1 Tax=Brevibacterium oceani TaxID=358099 RepID=UPI001B33EEBE|nr:MFS transporter [Brevibacterium oceani]
MQAVRNEASVPTSSSWIPVVLLMVGALGVSAGYGMLLLLPLYVRQLGGDEGNFGLILSSAVIPALVCLLALTRWPQALRPVWVLALAAGFVAIAAGIAALVTGGWLPLIGVGVTVGTAWAVIYTAAPMVMSAMVTDSDRSTFFGYLTGSEQLGIGLGPVVGAALLSTPLGFRGTFLVAAVVSLAAVAAIVGVAATTSRTLPSSVANRDASLPSLAQATRTILRSEAASWLIVVGLFACLFTAMTQFQTLFAADHNLSYQVFYLTYSAAVILVRFVIARRMAAYDSRLVIAVSVSVMAITVSAFAVIGSNQALYALTSAVLGLSYGLALPTAQAEVVNVSEESVRARVLPLAGLIFQGATLAFPLAVGMIVANYGYTPLFAVLVVFGTVQAAISWIAFARRRAAGPMSARKPDIAPSLDNFATISRIESLNVDCQNPQLLAHFWQQVLGWEEVARDFQRTPHGADGVRLGGEGLLIDFRWTDEPAPSGKNTWHLDLVAAEGSQQQELDRLLDQGAQQIDIGQGSAEWMTWHVLADPEGNVFCLVRGNEQ